MEMNQLEFARTLEQLKDTARLQGNVLSSEQITEAFSSLHLEEAQLKLIHEYLEKNMIGIDQEPAQQELSNEDINYLNLYLEELSELPKVTDGVKRAVTMSALAGDMDACNKLVEIYLPEVVEIAKLYTGQGALVEDLIGEGNVALAMGSTMLECVESIEEVEGFLMKMVMNAMEEIISEDADCRQADEGILEKVNRVYEKSKEMAEEILRKVTVEEVARELEISEEDVREAIMLSANHMDYIEDDSVDNN